MVGHGPDVLIRYTVPFVVVWMGTYLCHTDLARWMLTIWIYITGYAIAIFPVGLVDLRYTFCGPFCARFRLPHVAFGYVVGKKDDAFIVARCYDRLLITPFDSLLVVTLPALLMVGRFDWNCELLPEHRCLYV